MKRILIIIMVLCAAVSTNAQAEEQARQILVFRNTGEVNLFYSNELDSVTTTEAAQIFYSADTTLVVPFVELDSVAVGSRNEMKFYADVKELSKSDDLPWIIRFDGQSIFYRLGTPVNILPSVGMKLFYIIEEDQTEATIFPYGLSVRVTNVTRQAEEIRVDVKVVPLNVIFERLFLAGSFSNSKPLTISKKQVVRRVPVHTNLILNSSIDVEDLGGIEVEGNLEVSGNVVISLNPFHNHSNADLNLSYGFGTKVKLAARENSEYHFEELGGRNHIGTFYGILNLDAYLGAFADLSAELNLDVDLHRTYQRRLIWNRKDDSNYFEFKPSNADEPYEDKAQIDLTLKGDLFFGPIARIDFATVGDLAGARAKVKIGPKVEGEISLAMIQQMRNYQPQHYGNAKLDLCSQVVVEGFVINRHALVWGDVDEHKIFDLTIPFGEHEWRLLPDYSQTNATATTNRALEVKADAATKVEKPAPTDIETGFEIVNPKGEVVDSVYVGTIEAEPKESKAQTFKTEFILPPTIKMENLEGYTIRPVFHYAGYTVSAEPVGISKDVNLQPYTSQQSNGAMTFISSGPFLGSAVKDSTLYMVGMYLPVPPKNSIYKQGKESTIEVSLPIDENQSSLLCGTWRGIVNNIEVVLTFNDDGTGEYLGTPFRYYLNEPQSGEIMLIFTDGLPMLFRVVSLTETELRLINKRDSNNSIWVLKK